MIDQKYIFSFVGIILGWGLNQIAGMSARSIEKRQKLGLAIAALKAYHREAFLLSANLDLWKEQVSSWEEYERVRQYITKRMHPRQSHLARSVPDVLNAVATFDPLGAEDLDSTLTGLEFHSGIKLSKSAHSKELYVHELSILEVGIDLIVQRTAEALIRLSRKHSFRTWLLVRRHLRKLSSRKLRENASVLLDGMFEELRKIKEGQQTPGGDSEGRSNTPSETPQE